MAKFSVHNIWYRFATQDPLNSLNVVLYSGNTLRNRGGKFEPR